MKTAYRLTAATLLLLVCVTPSLAQAWPEVSLAAPVGGFAEPLQITHAGDGSGRLFVAEREGRIRIIKNGAVLSTPFLNIKNRLGSNGSLHGVAFPPGYTGKGYFYVKYTNVTCNIVVSRYLLSANPDVADANSEQVILSFSLATPGVCGHHGGAPVFSPHDGYLYISVGDGSPGGDPGNLAQNPGSLLGKMLRIDVETGNPATYTIPPTNPFNNTPGYRGEIWALGFRNPWRYAFDRLTGDLYIGDVGQAASEEVDFQPATSAGGENYGWRIMEGSLCYEAGTCNSTGLTLPVVEYDHSQGCSVTGGFVYRGAADPGMQGIYFYGDYCSGRIWGLRQQNGVWQSALLTDTNFNLVSFGEDEAGNIYVTDYSCGIVYQLVGAPATPVDLSLTQTVSSMSVVLGDQLTYTLQVTNRGSAEASGVRVTDTLAAEVDLVSATTTRGSCRGTRNIVCALCDLPVNATATINIVVKTKTAGTFTNTANVAGNETDPDPANNAATVTTTVQPLAVSNLTLNPATVTGSKTSVATVTLTGQAPTAGAKVLLASSNTAVATVPKNVTVAGANRAAFTVNTKPVASNTTVDISATFGGVTKTATLTIIPPTLSALTLTPNNVAGGCQTSTGKVTLTGKAPAGGMTVTLSNANSAAIVPDSVTVLANATNATFIITTVQPAATTTGNVTASYNGVVKSKSLKVRPAVGVLQLALAPNPVVGPDSVTGTVTLECAAPEGGLVVTLSSNAPGIANPVESSITVPAGQATGTFNVTTADVSATSYAIIKASANGVNKSVKLTVNP